MKTAISSRDRIIADLLRYGTWLASALIAAGLLLSLAGAGGHDAMKLGIALFILLPIARVAVLMVLFLRERDYIYTAIAALVLAIIAAGVLTQC